MRAAILLAIAGAVPVPFADDFEGPETNFSRWDSVATNAGNSLTVTAAAARSGSYGMEVVYAGLAANDQARPHAYFQRPADPLYLSFSLYVAAPLAAGSYLRVARIGDSATASGNPRVTLRLRREADPRMFVDLIVQTADAGTRVLATADDTELTAAEWHQVGLAWEPDAGIARLFIDGAQRFSAPIGDRAPFQPLNLEVGLASSASAQPAPLTLYFDDVALTEDPPPASKEIALPRKLRLGCDCDGAAGLWPLAALLAVRRLRLLPSLPRAPSG
jgi:hypothetical protein